MAVLADSGPYGSPNARPDHPGKPALQAMSEAQDRIEARRKWQSDHPMDMGPDDWAERSADYQTVDRGEDLLGACGGRTFEPGDAFVSRK